MRRKILVSVLLLSAVAWFSIASAQTQAFPAKTIRLVVPAAPGGSTDTLSRVLGRVIQEQTGVAVVIENKAGASGSIGVSAVVHSPADGYTLLVSVPDAITVYPLLKKNVPYRVEKDLTPITLVANTNFVFAVESKSKAGNLKDFIALAKAGKLSYATPGNGTSGHLVMEMLKLRTGIDLLHVPYKGSGPAMLSVIARETEMTATSPTSLKSFVDSGQLKGLAITKESRSAMLPNVPTMAESGYADFVIPAWFGVFAPAGVTEPVADRLNELVLAAIRSPVFVKHAASLGLEIDPVSRQAFGQLLTKETLRWKQLIEISNLVLED